jgi:cytochrome c oxidase subunit 2
MRLMHAPRRSVSIALVAISLFFLVAIVASLADIPHSLSSASPTNGAIAGEDIGTEKPVFHHPGLYKLPDGSYEADFATDISRFYPATMTVPNGSKVTFFVTSPHIVRGFTLAELPVYMEAGPGWETPATHVFDRTSTYVLVCSQYCGLTHMDMHAVIEVK